jgi:uncharacterized phage-associated protein
MEEDYITFDRAKLKAVVHTICATVDPDELGRVRLHKVLYYADMLHFMAKSMPLTGEDYVKQAFGPVARHLNDALADLERDGALRIEDNDYYGIVKKRYVSLKTPQTILSNSQMELLLDVIDFVRGKTGHTISDLKHNVPWQIAAMGERIPYAAVLGWAPAEITESDRAAALGEARRLRPLMEQASRENRVQ